MNQVVAEAHYEHNQETISLAMAPTIKNGILSSAAAWSMRPITYKKKRINLP